MPHLPEPKGPYAVGATTFLRPIRPSLALGTSKVKKPKHSNEPAHDELEHTLQLEEVAFTAFYPADLDGNGHSHQRSSWFGRGYKGPSKGVDWVIKPVDETIKGYEHFGGQSYPGWLGTAIRPLIAFFGSTIKIPAYSNAAPLAPSQATDKWPLLIFSHGLAGSRTTYSHLCAHLAAQGRVVLALEHRDGTGPAVFPRGADGQPKSLYYVNPGSVHWPDSKGNYASVENSSYNSEQAMKLRQEQLDFRRREVYEAVEAFKRMVGGNEDRGGVEVADAAEIDWSKWNGKIDFEHIDLVGHSFGGATVFSILSNPPAPLPHSPDRTYPELPVRKVLALDPWMEPFPSPGPAPRSSAELLVINSEAFTLWNSHFANLQNAVRRFQPGQLVTLVDAQHISFSDFPLLVPTRFLGGVDPRKMLGVVCTIADAFMGGKLKVEDEAGIRILEKEGVKVREMEVVEKEEKGKKKRKLMGDPGDVIIHPIASDSPNMRL
ncbi:hypothetical protein GLOTRDRAFT_79681 [Gloeophyllum trabeum ATCC 11539]|uniref:Putative phospholipase n=1 Tax=Gloeophyllum trabeum (strain ATCC 11539 / FP-39264 / Madison 617) TaxID=670483 RepID=S7RIY6_GLOTA|nr:uncharacterized protein GLOTRDRAFT_79681 [Gloeophyllum trabeum ATCC 11539]EPQ52569.1 hypothetical protein GLOTRDRAFT_79681 [Gloeophyllum trabeum ATCC 11539]